MAPDRVLVAFSSRTGSTAGIAEAVAAVLRQAGLAVDCRPAGEVADLAPYRAVVLGSGVFLPSRASDGGGFLTRHAAALASRPVWLFCIGPIGRGPARPGDGAGRSDGECTVVAVARAIGARGVAVFGTLGLPDGEDPIARLLPVEDEEVRAWARGILAEVAPRHLPAHPGGHRHHRRRHHLHGISATG